MELSEVMAAFAAEMGLDGLEADEDGIYSVELDEMEISFTEADGRLITLAVVGALPSEGREGLLMQMLEAMHLTDDATFSADPDSGTVFLQRFDVLASLDYKGFRARLEDFVSILEDWRGRFAGPSGAAEEESLDDIVIPPLGTGVGSEEGLIMV